VTFQDLEKIALKDIKIHDINVRSAILIAKKIRSDDKKKLTYQLSSTIKNQISSSTVC